MAYSQCKKVQIYSNTPPTPAGPSPNAMALTVKEKEIRRIKSLLQNEKTNVSDLEMDLKEKDKQLLHKDGFITKLKKQVIELKAVVGEVESLRQLQSNDCEQKREIERLVVQLNDIEDLKLTVANQDKEILFLCEEKYELETKLAHLHTLSCEREELIQQTEAMKCKIAALENELQMKIIALEESETLKRGECDRLAQLHELYTEKINNLEEKLAEASGCNKGEALSETCIDKRMQELEQDLADVKASYLSQIKSMDEEMSNVVTKYKAACEELRQTKTLQAEMASQNTQIESDLLLVSNKMEAKSAQYYLLENVVKSKDHELVVVNSSNGHLKMENQQLSSNLEQTEERVIFLQEQCNGLEEKIKNLAAEMDCKICTLDSVTSELKCVKENHTAAKVDFEGRILQLTNEKISLEEKRNKLVTQTNKLDIMLHESNRTIDCCLAETEMLNTHISKLEMQHDEDACRLEQYEIHVHSMELEKIDSEIHVSQLLSEKDALQETIAKVLRYHEVEMQSNEETIKELTGTLSILSQNADKVISEIVSSREGLNSEIKNMNIHFCVLQNSVETAENDILNVVLAKHNLESQIDEMHQCIKLQNNDIESLQREKKRLLRDHSEEVELLEKEKRDIKEIIIRERNKVQMILEDEQRTNESLLTRLKYDLSVVDELSAQISQQVGDAQEIQSLFKDEAKTLSTELYDALSGYNQIVNEKMVQVNCLIKEEQVDKELIVAGHVGDIESLGMDLLTSLEIIASLYNAKFKLIAYNADLTEEMKLREKTFDSVMFQLTSFQEQVNIATTSDRNWLNSELQQMKLKFEDEKYKNQKLATLVAEWKNVFQEALVGHEIQNIVCCNESTEVFGCSIEQARKLSVAMKNCLNEERERVEMLRVEYDQKVSKLSKHSCKLQKDVDGLRSELADSRSRAIELAEKIKLIEKQKMLTEALETKESVLIKCEEDVKKIKDGVMIVQTVTKSVEKQKEALEEQIKVLTNKMEDEKNTFVYTISQYEKNITVKVLETNSLTSQIDVLKAENKAIRLARDDLSNALDAIKVLYEEEVDTTVKVCSEKDDVICRLENLLIEQKSQYEELLEKHNELTKHFEEVTGAGMGDPRSAAEAWKQFENDYKAQLDVLKQSLQNTEKDKTKLAETIEIVTNERFSLSKELEEKETVIRKYENHVNKITNDYGHLQKMNKAFEIERDLVQGKQMELAAKLEVQKDAYENVLTQLDALQGQISMLQQQNTQAVNDRQQHATDTEKLQQLLAEALKSKESVVRENQLAMDKLVQAEKARLHAETEKNVLLQQLQAANESIELNQVNYEKAKSIISICQEDVTQKETILSQMNDEHSAYVQRYDILKNNFYELRSQLEDEKKITASLKTNNETQSIMKERVTELEGIVKSLTLQKYRLECQLQIADKKLRQSHSEKPHLHVPQSRPTILLDLSRHKQELHSTQIQSRFMSVEEIGKIDRLDDSLEDCKRSSERHFSENDTLSSKENISPLDCKFNVSGMKPVNHYAPNGIIGQFACEDEEGELFNYSYLTDLKQGHCAVDKSNGRMSELQRRNTLCLPHLKTSYPVETQMCASSTFTDDDLKKGGNVETCLELSNRTTNTEDGQRRPLATKRSDDGNVEKQKTKAKTIQSTYQKPGPPTPAKNLAVKVQGKVSKTPNSLKRLLRSRLSAKYNLKQADGIRKSLAFNIGISPRKRTKSGAFMQNSVIPFQLGATGSRTTGLKVFNKPSVYQHEFTGEFF